MTATMIDIEDAHLYGRGMSQTEIRAAGARAVAALTTAPGFWEQLARRAVAQAMVEATPLYWLRRSEYLETVGTSWADEAARNCRRHAWMLSQDADLDAELVEALDIVAGGGRRA